MWLREEGGDGDRGMEGRKILVGCWDGRALGVGGLAEDGEGVWIGACMSPVVEMLVCMDDRIGEMSVFKEGCSALVRRR